MQGFDHFVAKKLDLWPKVGTGGLNRVKTLRIVSIGFL